MLGLEDAWLAYQLDYVVALEGARGGDRPADKPGGLSHKRGGYAGMKGMAGVKRMKVPESGIW